MKQPGGLMKKLFGGGASDEIAHRSAAENIYHCCVHKTASQWIARILSAEETYRGCGLRTHRYQRELPGGADTRKSPHPKSSWSALRSRWSAAPSR